MTDLPDLAPAETEGRALLLMPDSRRGLQPADIDRIEDFAAESSPAYAQPTPDRAPTE